MDENLAEFLRWFEAARTGDLPTVESMLAEGFWTEAKGPLDGMTALMVAASEGRLDCARLLASESRIDERDPWGNTALLLAAAAGREEVAEMLLESGADPGVENAAGIDLEGARARARRRRGG